jgi:hypothetical protein
MASKPPNDRDGDPRDRRRPESTESSGTEPTFGSFISDSVRRSSARFRGEEEPERPSRRGRDASGSEPREFTARERRESREFGSRRSAPRSSEREEVDRFGVPRRSRDEGEGPDEPVAAAPAAGDRPAWMQEAIERAGSPERAMAMAGGAVLALILLIWLLASMMGGDDGGQPTATEDLQVLPIGQQGTPPSDPRQQIVTPTPPGEVGPTPRGSDNILSGAPVSTPAAAIGPPTAFCEQPCLARVERTPEALQVLAANRTRPSFYGDSWFWVVADPKGMETISSYLDTEVIRESAETLDLYMMVLPAPDADDSAAGQIGSVIDAAGGYRLVAAASVPANAKPVIDQGILVEKVAPAPPDTVAHHSERKQLTEADVGGLRNAVDPNLMSQTITELQGFGTRYYPTSSNQASAEYLFRELESYGLNVWYEHFVSWEGYLLVNVIGEIPGRDSSSLYGVMAHFDTISEAPTTAAPGADDNASGVAASLEIARVLSGWDLKYSLRIIFVNYEEQGIIGSQEWARGAVARGEPWEGVFNIDSVGSGRNGNTIILNSEGESSWMGDLIVRVNDAYGVGEKVNNAHDPDIMADDNRLRDQGIESVMIARELYGWSPVHHTTNDVMQNLSIPHTQNTAVLILLTVGSLMF